MNTQQKSRVISEKRLAASRRNGSKSRGPRTESGKHRSAMNRYKHGYYATPDSKTRQLMIEIGEDPDLTTRLERRLIHAWQPSNAMQELMVADLAKLYAKKELLHQVLIHTRVHEKRQGEALLAGITDKEIADSDDPIDEELLKQVGYLGVPTCMVSLNESISLLNRLARAAESGECGSALKSTFRLLYGERPQGFGKTMKTLIGRLAESDGVDDGRPLEEGSQDQGQGDGLSPESDQEEGGEEQALSPEQQEQARKDLVVLIKQEVFRTETEAWNYGQNKGEILRDRSASEWLPGSVNWGRANLQEAAIDREIERKVKLLVRLKWLERWGEPSFQSRGGAQPMEDAEWRLEEPDESRGGTPL